MKQLIAAAGAAAIFIAGAVLAQRKDPAPAPEAAQAEPQDSEPGPDVGAQPSAHAPDQTPPGPPERPPAPPDKAAAAADAGPSSSATTGQWVYTSQYGWAWMPYGPQYTYEPADSTLYPYAYMYRPVFGWTWVIAPWIWGWGPRPYFGYWGPWHFHWYHAPGTPHFGPGPVHPGGPRPGMGHPGGGFRGGGGHHR